MAVLLSCTEVRRNAAKYRENLLQAIPETGGDEEPALSDTDEGSANTGAAARLAKSARSYLCIRATSVP
ncbi:unnamed protein product [Pleuronectes platessa]|uniref:Uncharacterized protein n=1 Tax=Pleuronectes platessa TaxID=8262 RepID=A0A9N7YI94_PLEPL|nr:unnamed protein product [Pleuronectes platessa]